MKLKIVLTLVFLFGGMFCGGIAERLTSHHDVIVLCNSAGHCGVYHVVPTRKDQ
jgi:hypothetical protein